MKLTATSMERFNAGAKAKRLYGSSTATTFLIATETGKHVWVRAYGATPGARKTIAIAAAQPFLAGARAIPEGNSDRNPLVATPGGCG